jgi:hypothetical protein
VKKPPRWVESGGFPYYNDIMLTGFPLDNEPKSRMISGLFGAARWNQYVANWPVVLAALNRLWEVGKVSELKSPFYEPVERLVKH